MSEGSGRAFGKIILTGEHAVVFGIPALAAGIDRGATAHAVRSAEDSVQFTASPGEEPSGELIEALRRVRRALAIDATYSVTLSTDLPSGAGLGCSAALGVATTRALLSAESRPDVVSAVLEAAHAWETVFHGNPSGVDATLATVGGVVSFVRGEAPVPLSLPKPLRFAIGESGPGSSTKRMVDGVARLRSRSPELVDRTFDAIRSVSRNAQLALESGDSSALGQLLDMNQMLLAGLFVSTSELESLCRLAREAGALGAKLTGAGGGGCTIALCDDDASRDRVLAAWTRAGFHGFPTMIGATEGAPPSPMAPS